MSTSSPSTGNWSAVWTALPNGSKQESTSSGIDGSACQQLSCGKLERLPEVAQELAALKLDACLVKAGLEVIGGTSLFRLVRSKDAGRVFQSLGEAGIMVRRFAEHPAWLRFGLPGGEAEWQRLERALAAVERGNSA